MNDKQKELEIIFYILNIYQEVKNNEGWRKSRLREKLEIIISDKSILNVCDQYGLRFSNDDAAIVNRTVLPRLLSKYKEYLITNPELYQFGIKLLLKLREVTPKTLKQEKIKKLEEAIFKFLDTPTTHQVFTKEDFINELNAIQNEVDSINQNKITFCFSKKSYLSEFISTSLEEVKKININYEELFKNLHRLAM